MCCLSGGLTHIIFYLCLNLSSVCRIVLLNSTPYVKVVVPRTVLMQKYFHSMTTHIVHSVSVGWIVVLMRIARVNTMRTTVLCIKHMQPMHIPM